MLHCSYNQKEKKYFKVDFMQIRVGRSLGFLANSNSDFPVGTLQLSIVIHESESPIKDIIIQLNWNRIGHQVVKQFHLLCSCFVF